MKTANLKSHTTSEMSWNIYFQAFTVRTWRKRLSNLNTFLTPPYILGNTYHNLRKLQSAHGSEDPGKIGINNVLEKDVNLKISKKVQKRLIEQGIHVVMTREDDDGFYNESKSNKKIADMKKRVALINETKPDIAVSIHQNSYHEESIKGAQVFYYTHSKEGERAATVMQEALKALDTNNKRQAKENSTYYMLKRTEVPTIIVECGFLSNAQEAEKLKNEEYQDKVAEAICAGIIKWLD